MSGAPERRYTDRDLRDDSSLMDLATEYVMNYTGEFEPLIDAREILEAGDDLAVPMARKVLNCMRHDRDWQNKLPTPERSNVVQFRPPIRRKVIYDNQQCATTDSHEYHRWGEDNAHACEGVPFPVNRGQVYAKATIKVPHVASRTGKLIHDVDPEGPHASIWQGPRHGWGYRTDEHSWYDSAADLVVKTRCRFPSFLRNPILIKAGALSDYMEIPDVIKGIREMQICPHCAKVRDALGASSIVAPGVD